MLSLVKREWNESKKSVSKEVKPDVNAGGYAGFAVLGEQ